MDRCDDRCESAGPFGLCFCRKCNGRFHGVARITLKDLERLCDRKLRDHRLTKTEIKRWEAILRHVMELEQETAKRKAVA